MKNQLLIFSIILVFFSLAGSQDAESQTTRDENPSTGTDYILVIHGGAGNIPEDKFPAEVRKAYKDALQQALQQGEKTLKNKGTAMEAVIAAIRSMENHPLFNAAKGAVLTEQGHAELDASLMKGKTCNAGAVAGVRHIKNPILAAREVMVNSKHVLLAGDGADAFAVERGLDTVPQSYFITKRRKAQHEKSSKGTVGAVALDSQGNLAAGTSTGGMSNKKWGRIGDSPIIGAGTYADNKTCAVSGTGHGEFFIRNAVTYDIHARMLYNEQSLKEASYSVIHDILQKQYEAEGGIIAVDKNGNISMEFNTTAMFRAYTKSDGASDVKIFH